MTLSIRTSLSAILVLGAFAYGCGDDDDDDTNGGNMDAGVLLDGMAPTGDGAQQMGGGPYTGRVVVSTNTNETVPNLKVRLFDVKTGALIPGAETTSAGNGTVMFPTRPANAGLLVVGGGAYQDTYGFPPSRKGEEMLVRVGSTQSATLVPTIASYTAKPDYSALAGSVFWHNPMTDVDEFVGCAQVEGPGVEDVRYFEMGLPTGLANRPAAKGTKPPVGDPRTPSNEAEAGKYFAGNIKPGLQTVIVKINGAEVGRGEFFIIERSKGTPIGPMNTGSTLHLASIWVNTPTNPTPAGCN